jgi:hypothetical protein
LLILDAGQIGTDRNLGIFGNGFGHRLAAFMREKKPKGLWILCSCAPGQVSWTSEADGRTVFGHFVARGLSGEAAGWDPSSRGLSARGLAEYVRHQVARWVDQNRRAQQTPLLLSADDAVNFPLRPSVPPSALRAARSDPELAKEMEKRLAEGWARRDELETRRPFRHAPIVWRRYLETLLRAERLSRAGQDAEAGTALGELAGLERRLAERVGGIPFDEPLSLALAEANWAAVARADHDRAARYRETMAEALSELTGGAESRSAGPKPGPDRKVSEATTGPAEASTGAEASEPKSETAPEERLAAGTIPEKGGPAIPKKAEPTRAEPDKGVNVPGRPEAGPLQKARLTAGRDDGPPAYLEGQILVWAAMFQKLGASRQFGSSDYFAGRRAQSLRDLADLRTAAETAAAGDERVRHRIAPVVTAGDAARRRAQDGLFTAGPVDRDRPASDRDHVAPQRARELYQQAVRDADLFANSLDLVQRLACELPYLGEWQARRNARLGLDGLGEDFETLLEDAVALFDLIAVDPGIVDQGPTSQSALDEVLSAHGSRVKAVTERFDRAAASYKRLQGLLAKLCRETVDGDGPEQWRELDDLLAVPTIPAGLRLPLIRKVRAASASPLDRRTVTGRPTGIESEAAGRGGPAEGPVPHQDEADGAGTPSTAADPCFWGQALGMARLELGLLKLGGASEAELARLEGAYRVAKRSLGGGTPADAFDAFEVLSAVIRGAHAGQMARVEEVRSSPWTSRRSSDASIHRQLAEADRAARVLPLSYAVAWSFDDLDADRLDRFHRYAFLLWHGRRLLEDFAVDHAQLVLNRARLAYEDAGPTTTLALKEALDDAEARKSARLAVQLQSAAKLVIQDWGDHRLQLRVDAIGNVPSGDASALIGAGPALPVAVTAVDSHHDAREGTLVAVTPGSRTQPAEFLVDRVEATDEERTFTMMPGAFYRGRYFPADRDLVVTTNALAEPIAVTIHQSYRRVKNIPDQFLFHPGKGFLHPRSELDYQLKVEGKTGLPMTVRVKYGLEGQTEPHREASLELTAAKATGEIAGVVASRDTPVDRPRNLVVTVTREGGVKPLSKRVFEFRQILPKDYVSVVPTLSQEEDKLYLAVTRLRTDPVTDDIDVFVRVVGQTARHVFHRGEVKYFGFSVRGLAPPIPWSVTVEGVVDAFHGEISPNGPATTPAPRPEASPETGGAVGP